MSTTTAPPTAAVRHAPRTFVYEGITITIPGSPTRAFGTVTVGERKVHLKDQEYQVLSCLAQHPGFVITDTDLYTELYRREEQGPTKATIEALVESMREQLAPAQDFVERVEPTGYRLAVSPEIETPAPPKRKGVPHPSRASEELTLADLPLANERWVASKKTAAVALVKEGFVTFSQLQSRYPDLSPEEFERWVRTYATWGTKGLRAMYVQQYRDPAD